jgi:hypothetical protein
MFCPARLTTASQLGSPDLVSSSCQEKAHSARCSVPGHWPPHPASRGWTYPRNPTGARLSGDQRHFVAPGFEQLS